MPATTARDGRAPSPGAEAASTLILLPGLDGTGRLFADFVAALGNGVETIVVAYPAGEALGYAELEELVRARLPADRPFVLLGESFSGPLALSIAVAGDAGNLRGVVLCASFARCPRPALRPFRALASVAPLRALPVRLSAPLLLGRFATPERRREIARVSGGALRARLRAVLDVDVAGLLPAVRVPVLDLRASEDRLVPRAAARILAGGLPRWGTAEVEAPHLLLQAAPAAAAEHVLRFLGDLDAERASAASE